MLNNICLKWVCVFYLLHPKQPVCVCRTDVSTIFFVLTNLPKMIRSWFRSNWDLYKSIPEVLGCYFMLCVGVCVCSHPLLVKIVWYTSFKFIYTGWLDKPLEQTLIKHEILYDAKFWREKTLANLVNYKQFAKLLEGGCFRVFYWTFTKQQINSSL